MSDSIKIIANNKKAYHDYFVEESFEAGIVLVGTEVKSLRMGKCSIKESFIGIDNGEIFVYGMNISPYEKGNIFNKDPLRTRKLLIHKSEIMKLTGVDPMKGVTSEVIRFWVAVGLLIIGIVLIIITDSTILSGSYPCRSRHTIA